MSEVIEAAPKVRAVAPKQYKVTIHSGDDAGDKGDVVLAHNFKQILIQRDKEVTIGEQFLECLKHSRIDTIAKDENGNVRPVSIARFAYSVQPA